MTAKLPIAILIPHAGLDVPPELTDRIALTEAQIFNDADVYTDLIYDFRDDVQQWHMFPYARSIIDVNRANQEIPQLPVPKGDGIVKRISSYGQNVYAHGKEPDTKLEQHLINTYWQDWHNKLASIAEDESIKLVLDCHSMAAIGPSHYAGAQDMRPRISVSNFGDSKGQVSSTQIAITASPELTCFAAEVFGASLTDISDFAEVSQPYTVNSPFIGGADIWMHGANAQPWLMLEISRATYIGEQTGETSVSPPDMVQINSIKKRLWQAIIEIVASL